MSQAQKPEPEHVNVSGAKESIPTAYVAGRAGTTNRVILPTGPPGYIGGRIGSQGINSWVP
jgi:hypothetical protein